MTTEDVRQGTARGGKEVMEYPECEKMAAVREKSQVLSDFVDWLQTKGIHLAKWHDRGGADELFEIHTPYDELFADYFGIDLKAVERERRAMLDSIQLAAGGPQ
jgi:hypothetical protein